MEKNQLASVSLKSLDIKFQLCSSALNSFLVLAITCPSLQDPRYGSVSLTGNRVGDYANYQCDAGFTLEGDARRKCQVSGQWSGEVPSCVRKSPPLSLTDPL